jgi:hypothetical protein
MFVNMRRAVLVFWLMLTPQLPAFGETVAWIPADTMASGFYLYRAEGTCAVHGYFTRVDTYAGSAVQGVVTDPSVGGTYCHFMTAFNSAGESSASNYVEFNYVVAPPPQCPDVNYCKTLKGQARRQCLACR